MALAVAFVSCLAGAQPSHAPVCQTQCWVRDDVISPGKTSCEAGITAEWCEAYSPGNGVCGDQWFNDHTATCFTSNDVVSGPCNSDTIVRDGKTYRRIPSANDGINICCFYAVGSEVEGRGLVVSRSASPRACSDEGGQLLNRLQSHIDAL